jgi:hypothetical protein
MEGGGQMIITETVVVGFEPVAEHESMEKFEKEHDMNEWEKDESTVLFTYTRKQTWRIGGDA